MKKCVNGRYLEMDAVELAAGMEAARAREIAEKYRPLTETEVSRMLIAAQINALAVDDNTALRMRQFYPAWEPGGDYAAAFKVQRNGRLWRCIQAHTGQTGWEPENAASLWEQINEVHSGERSDPIPYEGNMALTAGLYYIQDGGLYLSIRDTVSPVYNSLSALTGLYVEPVV